MDGDALCYVILRNRSKESSFQVLALSLPVESRQSVGSGHSERQKNNSQLPWEVVMDILTVGREVKTEIPSEVA